MQEIKGTHFNGGHLDSCGVPSLAFPSFYTHGSQTDQTDGAIAFAHFDTVANLPNRDSQPTIRNVMSHHDCIPLGMLFRSCMQHLSNWFLTGACLGAGDSLHIHQRRPLHIVRWRYLGMPRLAHIDREHTNTISDRKCVRIFLKNHDDIYLCFLSMAVHAVHFHGRCIW